MAAGLFSALRTGRNPASTDPMVMPPNPQHMWAAVNGVMAEDVTALIRLDVVAAMSCTPRAHAVEPKEGSTLWSTGVDVPAPALLAVNWRRFMLASETSARMSDSM